MLVVLCIIAASLPWTLVESKKDCWADKYRPKVLLKNLPELFKDEDRTTKSVQTKFTTTLPINEVTEMKKKEFTYAINNQIREPYFNINYTMDIETHRPLIYYMEKAVDQHPKVFTGFKTTYFSKLGYFIDSINNVAGNSAEDKTYWQILKYLRAACSWCKFLHSNGRGLRAIQFYRLVITHICERAGVYITNDSCICKLYETSL